MADKLAHRNPALCISFELALASSLKSQVTLAHRSHPSRAWYATSTRFGFPRQTYSDRWTIVRLLSLDEQKYFIHFSKTVCHTHTLPISVNTCKCSYITCNIYLNFLNAALKIIVLFLQGTAEYGRSRECFARFSESSSVLSLEFSGYALNYRWNLVGWPLFGGMGKYICHPIVEGHSLPFFRNLASTMLDQWLWRGLHNNSCAPYFTVPYRHRWRLNFITPSSHHAPYKRLEILMVISLSSTSRLLSYLNFNSTCCQSAFPNLTSPQWALHSRTSRNIMRSYRQSHDRDS